MLKLKKKLHDNRSSILITRPTHEAIRLKKILDRKGFYCFVSPLISIQPLSYSISNEEDFNFIIFTSKNGIQNFKINNLEKKIVVVGDGTFGVATKKGMKNIINVRGDLEDLKNIMKPILIENLKILHPTSTQFNRNLNDFFENHNCEYLALQCYQSIMKNTNSEVFENFFNSCKDGLVTFFSRRTVISFKKEICRLGLSKNLMDKKFLVLSNSIKKELETLNVKNILVATQPNEKSMLDLIMKAS